MRLILILSAALAVASCSQTEPAPAETETAAPRPSPPTEAAAPARIVEVPVAFQGIWDYVDGTCDPASDLRVEIAERGITFYESHGAVTALTVESPEAIVVELAMRGEGDKWTTTERFRLMDDGRTLVISGLDDDEKFDPPPRKRCA